ncbi:MAG: TonB family protein [Acidobacteriota bacterium]
MDLNDRALILRAQQRDVAAFSALVERWWVYLVRFARSVVGEADAEDVVQDGLLTVWDKLPALRVPEAFPAWTVRIISRACFRRARLQRKMVPLSEAVWASDSRSARRIEAIDVERVLSALPPRQRAVMHLTVIEEMTDSQIVIDEAGKITDAKVLDSPGSEFSQAALDALKQWKFQPARGADGKPLAVRTAISFDFKWRRF